MTVVLPLAQGQKSLDKKRRKPGKSGKTHKLESDEQGAREISAGSQLLHIRLPLSCVQKEKFVVRVRFGRGSRKRGGNLSPEVEFGLGGGNWDMKGGGGMEKVFRQGENFGSK